MEFITVNDLPAGWAVCSGCDEIVPSDETSEHFCPTAEELIEIENSAA